MTKLRFVQIACLFVCLRTPFLTKYIAGVQNSVIYKKLEDGE